MIHLKNLFACILFLICSNSTVAQVDLQGRWLVHCPAEFLSDKSMISCGLCTTFSADSSEVSAEDFEMLFDKTLLDLRYNDNSYKVSYRLDTNYNTLEFIHLKGSYKFKILTTGQTGSYILKTSEGVIIFLTKV
jgi:hypothetical protein